MSDYFSRVSDKVQNHLKQLAGSVNLPADAGDPLDVLAGAWLEKEALFEGQTRENRMDPVDFLPVDEERGGLVMTYSGSLLSLGPLSEGKRRVEYVSVGFRTDVPEFLEEEEAELAGDVMTDEPVRFRRGPIQKSSPVYRIALVNESVEEEEAEELLSQVTQVLTDEFVEVNKTLIEG